MNPIKKAVFVSVRCLGHCRCVFARIAHDPVSSCCCFLVLP